MRSRILALLSLCLVASALSVTTGGSATAVPAPPGSAFSEVYFPSGDGTMLHGELLLPTDVDCESQVNADGTTGCPVIVSVGPYFGSGVQDGPALGFGDLSHEGVANRFFDFITYEFATEDGGKTIFEMGYAWLQVDSRGFGSSGGCNDYGGHGEQMDVEAAVNWAAQQDFSNGRVGMWGKSYDGWTQVMGLAENPVALDAVVIQAPLIERYGIGYVNGVHHSATWYVTTELYALYDYTPPAPLASDTSPEELLISSSGSATDPCWVEQNAQVLNPDHDAPYWQEGDLRPRASRNDDVAVFWVHGFTDVNTKPDQVFGVYEGLNDVNADQTRAWFGQWNHVRGTDVKGGAFEAGRPNEDFVVGRAGFHEEALDWFNHYLKGEEFVYQVNAENLVEVQDNLGEWRTEAQYPAVDTRFVELPITPGTYSDSASSTGFWSLSDEITEPFRIAGESTVTLDVTTTAPFANFVGVLYDVNGTRAEEISRSMFRIEESGTYSFRTHPGDWIMEEGHQLGFKIMSAHPQSFPYPTGQTVTVNEGTSITIPVPTYEREVNLTGTATSARSLQTTTLGGTINEADWDLESLAPIAYPDAAERERVQGPVEFTRPVD